MENIRNFCIIAHIDHGKSTLADRFLELTGTIPERRMKEQYLDQLDLERERGVTIKMAPVRMSYDLNKKPYILNLIDTPGHSDFSYEVSRALAAVEGAILLVDATQGIQAQTLANFHLAEKTGLKIIGVINKIDLKPAQTEQIIKNLADLIGVKPETIYKISGKTGEGVKELLEALIKFLPPPKSYEEGPPNKIEKALVFDSFFDNHQGIIASVRIVKGEFSIGQTTKLMAAKTEFKIKELGYFSPELYSASILKTGEIGYIATGIKDPDKLKIGDTIGNELLTGYKEPQPVVFVSFYPEEADDYEELKKSLQKLRLNDSALQFEPDYNEILGRGFKTGFLGRFHFEITAERLTREFKIKTVQSFPSVAYQVHKNGENFIVTNAQQMPLEYDSIAEPIIKAAIMTPAAYLGKILQLKDLFRVFSVETKNFGDRMIVEFTMPLADFFANFDDQLKSVSEGFASFSYEQIGYKKSDLARMEILIAGEVMPGLSRIVPKEKAENIGRQTIEKLKELLPRQQFVQALQASANGRIVARENIAALKKDVTGYLYGGDRTRKMKLWKKQQRGKKRLKEIGRVDIPADVYRKLI